MCVRACVFVYVRCTVCLLVTYDSVFRCTTSPGTSKYVYHIFVVMVVRWFCLLRYGRASGPYFSCEVWCVRMRRAAATETFVLLELYDSTAVVWRWLLRCIALWYAHVALAGATRTATLLRHCRMFLICFERLHADML